MNGYLIAISLTAGASALAYIVFHLTVYPQLRGVVQKYPLFAARDELVQLKLKGAFDHHQDLYVFYMAVCNDLIVSTKDLNFLAFLAHLTQVAPADNVQSLREQIRNAPEEIRDFNRLLWRAVCTILYENSTLLRILMHTGLLHWLHKLIEAQRSTTMLPVKQYIRIDSLCHV